MRPAKPSRAERRAASEKAALDAQWAALEAPSPSLGAKPAAPAEPRPAVTAPTQPVKPLPVTLGERVDQDLLDKTRELLMPVADLLALQGEMQSALERLAGSLEQFAAEMLTDSQGRTPLVNTRLQELERELEATRSRLREAEALLPQTAAAQTAPDTEAIQWPAEVAPITLDSLVAESRAAAAASKMRKPAPRPSPRPLSRQPLRPEPPPSPRPPSRLPSRPEGSARLCPGPYPQRRRHPRPCPGTWNRRSRRQRRP